MNKEIQPKLEMEIPIKISKTRRKTQRITMEMSLLN
jgi:hypothetical protein